VDALLQDIGKDGTFAACVAHRILSSIGVEV